MCFIYLFGWFYWQHFLFPPPPPGHCVWLQALLGMGSGSKIARNKPMHIKRRNQEMSTNIPHSIVGLDGTHLSLSVQLAQNTEHATRHKSLPCAWFPPTWQRWLSEAIFWLHHGCKPRIKSNQIKREGGLSKQVTRQHTVAGTTLAVSLITGITLFKNLFVLYWTRSEVLRNPQSFIWNTQQVDPSFLSAQLGSL